MNLEPDKIGLIVSIALFIFSITFKPLVKRVNKEVFSNLSKKKLNIIFVSLLFISLSGVSLASYFIYTKKPNLEKEQELSKFEKVLKDAENGIKTLKGVDSTRKSNKLQRQKRDSITIAQRPERWVYQIGEVHSNMRQLGKVFNNLIKDNPDLYVFKKNRKEHYIILEPQTEKSKSELTAAIIQLEKEFIRSTNIVKVFDLNAQCDSKDMVKQTKLKRVGKIKSVKLLECK